MPSALWKVFLLYSRTNTQSYRFIYTYDRAHKAFLFCH
ncbi:hypothetical protein DJ88_4204 [Bacillus paralicheniformis]|nr:hypothetical protein DJ88_4204 [Bacillus paralicheniformis]